MLLFIYIYFLNVISGCWFPLGIIGLGINRVKWSMFDIGYPIENLSSRVVSSYIHCF